MELANVVNTGSHDHRWGERWDSSPILTNVSFKGSKRQVRWCSSLSKWTKGRHAELEAPATSFVFYQLFVTSITGNCRLPAQQPLRRVSVNDIYIRRDTDRDMARWHSRHYFKSLAIHVQLRRRNLNLTRRSYSWLRRVCTIK
jgi:hypothetical protein